MKVAGMVDIVARIVADGDKRTFNFKSDEVIFGGGRLKADVNDIPLDVNALFAVYDEANRNAIRKAQGSAQEPETSQVTSDTPSPENASEKSTRTRRRAVSNPEEKNEPIIPEVADDEDAPAEAAEEKPAAPKRARRSRKTTDK